MSQQYIEKRFMDIKKHANAIEARLDDSWCTIETTLEENTINLEMCKKYGCEYILIDDEYEVNINL